MSLAAAIVEAKPTAPTDAPAPVVAADGPKPVDPEKRAKLQRRAAARKLIGKVSAADDAESFWKQVDELAKKEGRAVAVPTAKPAGGGKALAFVDPEKVAKWEPAARQAWEGVAQILGAVGMKSPTVAKFAAAMAIRDVEVIGADEKKTTVTVDPIANLSKPAAKLCAKYLPEEVAGPEAEMAAALAAVFLPVALALVFESLSGRLAAAEEEPAEEPTKLEARS